MRRQSSETQNGDKRATAVPSESGEARTILCMILPLQKRVVVSRRHLHLFSIVRQRCQFLRPLNKQS